MNKAERGKFKNADSHWELNPGPLTSAISGLTTELQQPDNHQHFTILYMYMYMLHKWYECFSHALGSKCLKISVCSNYMYYADHCGILKLGHIIY